MDTYMIVEVFKPEYSGQITRLLKKKMNQIVEGIVYLSLNINIIEGFYILVMLSKSETLIKDWMKPLTAYIDFKIFKIEENLSK